ncbi:MAG: PIG-L family deacetylase, partial [Acidobacteriota bacterium]|nr:PIG-L family deacetylase [Acidobacteriota bacterium]
MIREGWRERLLVVAPHADDETFACGGLLARLGREGTPATVFVVSARPADEKLRHRDDGTAVYEQYSGETRRRELAVVAEILGFTVIEGGFPLHQLDTIPREQLIHAVERTLEQVRPTCVLAVAPGYDQDHRAVYEAVLAATRPHRYGGCVLIGEPQSGQIHPNFYVTLSEEDAARKCQAVVSYHTQRV